MDILLFVRDQHSVRLTRTGREFVEDARKIVYDYDEALARLSQNKRGVVSTIKIGFLLGAFGSFLPLVCREYTRTHPEVDFQFNTLEIDTLHAALEQDKIDFSFTAIPKNANTGKHACLRLYRDKLMLVVPHDHPLSKKSAVKFSDLRSETVYMTTANSLSTFLSIKTMLQHENVDVRGFSSPVDFGAVSAKLITTDSLALSLNHLAFFNGAALTFVPIDEENLEIDGVMLWKKGRENELMTNFVESLRENTKTLVKEDFVSKNMTQLW